MKKQVVVLMGGTSGEREVSLRSGAAVAKALVELGYQVRSIDVGEDMLAKLQEIRQDVDVVFNALHGSSGENGCVQGVCELLSLPYTHSDVLASAVAMNKPVAKNLFIQAGIPVPSGSLFSVKKILEGDPMPRPFVVKPIDQGSSIGVHIIREGGSLPFKTDAGNEGQMVLVEEYVPGRELTVAIMRNRSLEVCEVRPADGFYDYESKYVKGRSELLVPAPIPSEIRNNVMDFALTAHKVLTCRGVTRADFRYDDTDNRLGLRLLEINTQPGLTPTSLVPKIAAYVGIEFASLINWMVEDALCNT